MLLVEKTDRLYRNLKDWVTIDELDVEIHFLKEGVVLSRDSRSSEKFMHGIKVLMAKNYIDNLSEETRKGMLEKAEQGIWPTKAPLGYRNVDRPRRQEDHRARPRHRAAHRASVRDGTRPARLSLKEAARRPGPRVCAIPEERRRCPISTVHKILRNRLYSGDFDWTAGAISGTARADRLARTVGAGPGRPRWSRRAEDPARASTTSPSPA